MSKTFVAGFVSMAFFALAASLQGGVAPDKLRCEYHAQPLAVDAQKPRLSWLVTADSSERGQAQTAYRILVAKTLDALKQDRGDLWDSGKVASDQSTQIAYAGPSLGSRTTCHWKVQIWDRDGKPSAWSEPASWSMGLLNAADWKAQWIGGQRANESKDRPGYLPAVYLRKPFALKAAPQRAIVYVTAAGIEELRINGARVGNDFFTPGWTNYDKRLYYFAYDVTKLLRTGDNVLGAVLGDGWYGLHHRGRGKLSLLAQLHVEYADGTQETVASDASWKTTSNGPIRMSDIYQGEDYDARKELTGWDSPGYNDAAWDASALNPFRSTSAWLDVTEKVRKAIQNGAVDLVVSNAMFGDPVYGTPKSLRIAFRIDDKTEQRELAEGQPLRIGGAGKKLVIEKAQYGADVQPPKIAAALRQSHPGSPVQKTQTLKVVRRTEPKPGRWVFDLGQNFSGWARLKVNGPAGTKITLRFAEILNPDGTIYTTNLRAAKATDTYILRGQGDEVWEPALTFHGFRYVEVTGLPTAPADDTITGIVLHSNAPQTSAFECSNPMLNQLFKNTVWGQRSNYFEVPTDCPQRDERMGWAGDAQAFIGTAIYNMDVAPFFTAWLRTYEDCQNAEGSFADIAPVGNGGASPGWGDAGVICPWTIYRVYGDRRMLEERYPSMCRWIAWMEKHSKDCVRPDEGYGDWLNVQAELPKDVISTAYFAYSTSLMVQAAKALGKTDDAARFQQLLARIKTAFNRAFVAADGRIKGHTQTAYLMALGFDLLPAEKRPLAAAHLIKLIDERKGHLSTGFLGVNLLLPVLTDIGRVDVAYRLLQNQTYPSWSYSIKHGATTIWERWDGWTEDRGFQDAAMNSFNHYAYGSCGQWMFAAMAGIDTEKPGFQRIVIRPRIGGEINDVKASYDSIRGRIATHWRQEAGHLRLDVTIPANTTATVYVPAQAASNVAESGKPAATSPGVKFVRLADGAAVYQIGSGSYSFQN
jgi:alpha-L-rhamnosidase